MTARFAKDDMSFVIPTSVSSASSMRRSAAPGRTAAPSGLGARLAGMVQWLVEMPRRRAVIDELSSLSDHELSDIGLTRGELSRVFDHSYAAGRNAAHAAR